LLRLETVIQLDILQLIYKLFEVCLQSDAESTAAVRTVRIPQLVLQILRAAVEIVKQKTLTWTDTCIFNRA
jgi:hypothetical protein